MKLLLTFVAFYAAFVVHVALHYGPAAAWAPNLTLIVGLAAARGRGGVAWPALAGLLCDCLDDRPLGTTMLVATLAVTVGRQWRTVDRPTVRRTIAAQFLLIFSIELFARLLTAFAAGHADVRGAAMSSLMAATSSAVTVAAALVLFDGVKLLVFGRRQRFDATLGTRSAIQFPKRAAS